MKRTAMHLLRTVLLNFMAMFVIGAVVAGSEHAREQPRLLEQLQREAAERGDAAPDPASLAREADARYAATAWTKQLEAGLFGALFGLATLLVLRAFFPVGPTSKIVIGAICGAFLALLLVGAGQIREGKAQDLPGIAMVGLIVGLLTGLLEANRVFAERRA